MFEKILVAVEGSEQSYNALGTACDVATKYDSQLYLVHSPQLETAAIVFQKMNTGAKCTCMTANY